jgi:aspartyl/glutamyl-tRNA(Asn/Gln) amidotransferase C subunit
VPSKTSPVDPDVVRKIAALARLSVPDADLSLWTQQLGRIVSYIDQLKELPEGMVSADAGSATPLRGDAAREDAGLAALQENVRELLHNYVEVPRIVGGSSRETHGEREPSVRETKTRG